MVTCTSAPLRNRRLRNLEFCISSGLPGHEARTENSGQTLRRSLERAAAANRAPAQLRRWNAVRRSLTTVDLRRTRLVSLAIPWQEDRKNEDS
uniref:Uncharacterized protein n=1 Tax=Oryza brachyantha TaxID=4533 RepID=J3LUC4_ORYBR